MWVCLFVDSGWFGSVNGLFELDIIFCIFFEARSALKTVSVSKVDPDEVFEFDLCYLFVKCMVE